MICMINNGFLPSLSVDAVKKRKMSSSNSPCAACKCLRRKCTQECVFAPYFPPDNPQKFTNVHKVFGASNVSKLLNELNASQREDAVNSLAYEAEYRLRDPVYGCVGLISILQHKLKQVQHDLDSAKKELATYIGPSAMLPILNHSAFIPQPQNYQVMPYNMAQPMMGVPHGTPIMIRDPPPPPQYIEAMAAAAAREQEMMRNYEQQQQQNELLRFNGGFDEGGAPVTATGFSQMAMPPSLALGGSYETLPYSNHVQDTQSHVHSNQLHLQPQEVLLQQNNQQQQSPPRAKSEEGRSIVPLC